MSMRSTWKGHIKIGMLAVPVKVYGATSKAESISFNKLHVTCKGRIKQRDWCEACQVEVKAADVVKGYEHAKGQYAVFAQEEIDAAKLPSTQVVELGKWTQIETVPAELIDQSYFLAPDGDFGRAAYNVVLAAVQGTPGRVAVGSITWHGHERQVMVRAVAKGFIMSTLLDPSELRSIDDVTELRGLPNAKADEVKMAKQMIEVLAKKSKNLDVLAFKDGQNETMKEMIAARIAGSEYIAPVQAELSKSVSLMDALTASLAAVEAPPVVAKAKPAKVVAIKSKKTKAA